MPHWLVKARVRPGAEEALQALLDPLGEAGDRPYTKELRKALAARPSPDAQFYFPVEGAGDAAKMLGLDVADHLDVRGTVKMHVVESGYGLDEDEPARGGRRREAKPRRRRASEEDD